MSLTSIQYLNTAVVLVWINYSTETEWYDSQILYCSTSYRIQNILVSNGKHEWEQHKKKTICYGFCLRSISQIRPKQVCFL